MRYKKDVIFLGRIEPRSEVDKLISGALAFSYISNFEGFGLPVLEAMRCKVPVITSNCSALPEVVGNAALLIDPTSIDKIVNAYEKVYADAALRNSLVEKGSQQIRKFNWDDTAKKIWEVISSI